MNGPNHLVFQLVGGSLDMYGPKHIILQLSRGVGA